MDEKTCRDCGQTKPLDQFYRSTTQPCRSCWCARVRARYAGSSEVRAKALEASRRWRAANLDKAHANEKKSKQKRRKTIQDQVREYKGAHPCADCSRNLPPWVMQFDHRPGEEKLFNLSRLVKGNTTFRQVEQEIAKCDLVCGVCHAHRTYCRMKGLPYEVVRGTKEPHHA